ncbi:hypothetical protein QUF76_13225, partial [Desulfobacterales bacterium HSG16]|nr:hypothetical protein [Desulfobacterales bacterium HSG16]
LDEWIYFLKNEEIKDDFKAKGLKKAKQELDVLKLSEEERMAYVRYKDDLHYQASMFESSFTSGKMEGEEIGVEKGEKIGIKKGEKIGIKKGEKIGIKKGEKIGIKKGKMEGREEGKMEGREEGKKEKAVEIAISLISGGNMDTKTIASITRLTEEEIKKLKPE